MILSVNKLRVMILVVAKAHGCSDFDAAHLLATMTERGLIPAIPEGSRAEVAAQFRQDARERQDR